MAISTFYIIVVGWYRPFETWKANKLELFTETITLGVLDCLMMFTNFVSDPETRYSCGNLFIAVILLYTAVHLAVMMNGLLSQMKACYRRRYQRRRPPTDLNEQEGVSQVANQNMVESRLKKGKIKKVRRGKRTVIDHIRNKDDH